MGLRHSTQKVESLDRKNLLKFKINIRTLNSFITHGILLKLPSYSRRCLNLFDRVFTFDDNDAREYDFMTHLPLFLFLFFVSTAKKTSKNFKPSIAFLGTVHSDRYRVLGEVYEKYKNEYDLRFVLYFLQFCCLGRFFLLTNFKSIIRFKLLVLPFALEVKADSIILL